MMFQPHRLLVIEAYSRSLVMKVDIDNRCSLCGVLQSFVTSFLCSCILSVKAHFSHVCGIAALIQDKQKAKYDFIITLITVDGYITVEQFFGENVREPRIPTTTTFKRTVASYLSTTTNIFLA